MARPLRIEYPGAFYHVISRGNRKQDIFLNDVDRLVFLNNLEHCVDLHNLVCHAYCLMGNHYHLLIETPDSNLSTAMRDINGNYSTGFNARHDTVGHLLQGRYKAFVIEKETYALAVTAYIVNNPVKDGFVKQAKEWAWSSYAATVGLVHSPNWLEPDFTLSLFSKNRSEARKKYAEFVEAHVAVGSPYDGMKGSILGSPQFVSMVWDVAKGSEEVKEYPREERIIGRPNLGELFDVEMTEEQRNAAIRLARYRCGYLNTEIAAFLNLDPSTVGKITKPLRMP